MAKYKAVIYWSDGEVIEEDNYGEYFSSEEEAEDAAIYAISCTKVGAEELHWNNPGEYDYDEDDCEDPEYEIVKV